MSRYFYYPVILTMVINTIFFVPRLLLEERFDGAITAMMICIPLGTLLAFLFTKGMSRFPGLGLPEILERFLTSWLRVPLQIFLGIMWFIAGTVILAAFSLIAVRVISPDIPRVLLLLCSILVTCWSSTRKQLAVVNVMEIGILLSLPFIAFITFKALSNELMDWDAVRSMSDYMLRPPSWQSMSAASYIFTGYLNLALTNRLYKDTRVKHLWLIPVMGTIICFTSFFVPIGFHGTQAVNEYIFVWFSTADSIIMHFGFIERVLFVFLFMYIGLALLFTTLTWNIGLTLIRSCFRKRLGQNKKRIRIFNWAVSLAVGAGSLLYGSVINEKELVNTAAYWFNLRLPVEIFLVGLVAFLGWRSKHA
ncbi:GerAB/ArcD/ProY family transporter [Paenibacillus thermotolerans]|uniref:GerAB/ArcD/ProY family transporter n=1 Tax=Paenibacillus thermotolerans TaxID=3027807 RepID=UPI002368645C|nr:MULTISPECIES: GerAB/ArcD/ProY family transporter [unclassified Paenibacillus]